MEFNGIVKSKHKKRSATFALLNGQMVFEFDAVAICPPGTNDLK